MRILIVGASGTIGKKVATALESKHEIIRAGRTSGDILLDMAAPASVMKMYAQLGKLDAVVCTAGEAKWKPFANMSQDDFFVGLSSKLMGQVNLVQLGLNAMNEGGSFTLTSGILAEDPVDLTTSAAMVNGGLHSFTLAANLEMPRGLRINTVCAGLVEDSAEKYADYFPGYTPVSMQRVVDAYIKSIAGKISGQIIKVY